MVVTIIVLLLALLAPGLEKVKATAYRAKCLTNLHGISGSLTLYFHDYKQRFPVHYINTWGSALLGSQGNHNYDAGQTPSDQRVLNPYLGYTGPGADVKIAECPSDIGDQMQDSQGTSTAITYPLHEAIGTSYLPPYGNHSGVEYTDGWAGNSAVAARPPKKITRIHPREPDRLSNKIIFGDWTFWGNRPLAFPTTQWHCDNSARRHNIVFADMHAEWFFFENEMIDYQYGGQPNLTRPSSPSFHWW